MYQFLLVMFLLIAISLIVLIMIQQGKDVSIGTSFSISASNTLFGSSGSNNFITRVTIILVILFFILSLVLDNIISNNVDSQWNNLNSIQQIDNVTSTTEILAKSDDDIPH